MASGGVLAIDEIGQADEQQKSALHEVMEQNTVSISKAGINATLKAECSVLAAGNPIKGYFDKDESLPKQMGIPPALWTRFDLIFTIFDEPNVSYDTAISKHILRNHRIAGMIQNSKHAKTPCFSDVMIENDLEDIKVPVSIVDLQKYIAYSRTLVFPVSTPEVEEAIKDYYVSVRGMKITPDMPVPITARSLEAIQRLTEASARMRLSNRITLEDVEFVKRLISKSLRDIGLNDENILDANLLIGMESKSQLDKIRLIKNNIKANRTEEEIMEIMRNKYQVDEEKTKQLIKKLFERNEIGLNPKGYLKVIG
jgi:replicative DNA helicase Mcm